MSTKVSSELGPDAHVQRHFNSMVKILGSWSNIVAEIAVRIKVLRILLLLRMIDRYKFFLTRALDFQQL